MFYLISLWVFSFVFVIIVLMGSFSPYGNYGKQVSVYFTLSVVYFIIFICGILLNVSFVLFFRL